MPQIPTANQETRLNGATRPYVQANLNADMFGANVAKSFGNLGAAVNSLGHAADKIAQTISETQVMEFNNEIEKWKQDTLLDKENGYFTKTGSDAAGKSKDIMKSYDDFVLEWKAKNKVHGIYQKRIDDIAKNKRTGILGNVTNHDMQQTKQYAIGEGALGVDNAITAMVSERNNPKAIETQLANIKQISSWQGELQKLDKSGISLLTVENISKAHEAILDTFIQEGDLEAGEYFEKYKNQIRPQVHAKYIGAIKDEKMKYQAKSIADSIIANSSNEREAMQKAEEIKDINMSDRVVQRVKRYFGEQEHYKREAQKQALNEFYIKAVEVQQQGGTLSYDDIPDNIDPEIKLSLINYVNRNGQVESDDNVWHDLYEMSVNNAQGFIKEDLNKYRGYLSDSEYKQFVKRQEEIKSGSYFTQIKDDNQLIEQALKAAGLGNNSIMPWSADRKDIAYSETRAMVREFEARKGRRITDEELLNIVNSLGHKGAVGVENYKLLEQGMRERTGFIKSIVNDFVYYQSKHNGEMPSNEEKSKIINNRLTNYNLQKNDELINSLDYKIRNTTAKPNETKELTYYADSYLPQLGKQLGVKFTIVEGGRYRKPNGKYVSHHSAGEAADVSMSEHSIETRYKFIESQINNPQVKAIGTSDPNILAKYGTNKKIVDERNFDKKHGTNHRNHAHITLNTQGVKMRAPDGRIVHVPQNMVDEAIRNGGVRI